MTGSYRGYTLIEVLVVVVILGILTSMAGPNFMRWLHQYRLQAASSCFMNHLRAARLLAIFKGVKHQVQLKKSGEGNYYQVVEDPGKEDKIVMSIGRIVFHQRFGEILMKSIPLSGRVNFYPRGTSDNATILLENAAGVRLKIVVNQFGRVRSEYL